MEVAPDVTAAVCVLDLVVSLCDVSSLKHQRRERGLNGKRPTARCKQNWHLLFIFTISYLFQIRERGVILLSLLGLIHVQNPH